MTKPRDPEALLSAYLAEGMEVLPDRVADAVLDEVHRTRQRAVLGPWRTRSVSRTTSVAAAVVAMLALGAALFVVAGGPSPTPSEEPRPSLQGVVAPSSTPSDPSAEPTASPVTNPAGVWIATGTMTTPRDVATAVRLVDGRVLVLGGSSGDSGGTSAELYDPISGTWSATGNMVRPIAFPPTLLGDGRVLAGDALDEGRPGAELYDPNTGTWSATGQMVRSADFVGDTADLRDKRRAFVRFQVSVEMAREHPRDGLRSQRQGSDVSLYHRHTSYFGAQTAQRPSALIESEAAAGKLRREHSRTGTDIHERRGRKPRKLTCDLATFFADGFGCDLDPKAAEVADRTRDAAVIIGRPSVVVGPQRRAMV